WLPRGLCGFHWLSSQTERKHHSSTPRSLSRASSVKPWSRWLPGLRSNKRAGRYSRLGCLGRAARERHTHQDTPYSRRADDDTGGSCVADTASTEISPSLTCENHVQHGKQVLTSTTLICPGQ